MTRYFFIVGCGRSGTTVLQQALNRHSRIVIPPETRYFSALLFTPRTRQQLFRRIAYDLQIDFPILSARLSNAAAARALYSEIARRYLNRLRKSGETWFGEKSGENLFHVYRIRKLWPDAKFILMYRDGRDVALSLTKVPWAHPDLYVNYAVWLYYARLHRAALAEHPECIYPIRYEDFVAAPQEHLRRILAFLQLDYEPQIADRFGNSEGVPAWELAWKSRALEPINQSRVGIWRTELSPAQVALLEGFGGRALTRLGYELVSPEPRSVPWHFFPILITKIAIWRAKRLFSAGSRELIGSNLAAVEDCKRALRSQDADEAYDNERRTPDAC